MKTKKTDWNIVGKVFQFLLCFLFFSTPFVHSASYDLDAGDRARVDEAIKPLNKIIGFIRYASTTIGLLVLSIAGIVFAVSQNDPKRKDSAKSTMTYAVIGMGVVWASPVLIQLIQ